MVLFVGNEPCTSSTMDIEPASQLETEEMTQFNQIKRSKRKRKD